MPIHRRQHLGSIMWNFPSSRHTVYPKKFAHGFVVLCFVVVMQSFIMNSHEVFTHIHQGCFAGTGAIVRLPQCQWSKPDGYGKISQCITTTKHSKAKTVCIFLGIYCIKISYWNANKFRTKSYTPFMFWFPKPLRMRNKSRICCGLMKGPWRLNVCKCVCMVGGNRGGSGGVGDGVLVGVV